MAERYQIITHSEDRLYQNDCPVICNAYNILKDKLTDTLLLQAKFENLSKKAIKEINFAISGYDISGNLLVENFDCEYVAQNIGYRATFGDDTPITLDNNKIRKIDITIRNILFDNNDLWTNPNISKMSNLPEQKNIEEYLCSDELISEYNILTPKVSYKRKFPIFNENYWLCTCGEINPINETICSTCKTEKEFLKKIINKEFLFESLKERKISLEQKNAIILKNKKRNIIIFCLLSLIISIILVITVIIPKQKLNKQLNEISQYLNSGEYINAIYIADNASDKEAAYDIVIEKIYALIDEDEYLKASELTNYLETNEFSVTNKKIIALEFSKRENYETAYAILNDCTNYIDVQDEIGKVITEWMLFCIREQNIIYTTKFTDCINISSQYYDEYYNTLMNYKNGLSFDSRYDFKTTEERLSVSIFELLLKELPVNYKDVNQLVELVQEYHYWANW